MRSSHDPRVGQILEMIEAHDQVSQRSLARELGIALGLTNLLLKRLALRGLIRVRKVKRQRVRYLLTPAGIAEKTRMSRRLLEDAVQRYSVARGRLELTFAAVSAAFPADSADKPVVFVGTGEVAEIAFICVQNFDLRLVAAVDDSGKDRFFGLPVFDDVRQARQAVPPDARFVVTALADTGSIRARLVAGGVPPERVSWV